MPKDEGIQVAHHFGIGLPDLKAVEALKNFLVARGAEIVAEDPKPKYFLRLNPGDTLLLEVFLSGEEATAHVDYTVDALENAQTVHPILHDYGIPNMLFLDLPGAESLDNFSLQIAFTERD